MPLSNSVLHRYTPPTCTLQVVAYSSPVSRWVGSKVVKEVQFDLRFDDPRSLADKQFSIKGDRNQLEALHTVVSDYIQELLNLSPDSFATLGQETPPAPSVDVESDVWLLPTGDLPPKSVDSDRLVAQSESFTLKPATKVSHNLFLGALATAETGQFIQLSLLQLFDLATALDEYKSDLIALPTSYPNITQQTASAPLAWANIAAVLLLGVGVTAIGLQLFNRPNSPQTASNPNNPPKTANNPQVALAPSISPTLSPATTLLVPSPNSNIPAPGSSAIVVPNPSQVPQTVPPGTKTNPVPNGSLPQSVVINPTARQTTTTTTTVTIPGASNRTAPSVAVLPKPNLNSSPRPASAKITTAASQDNTAAEPPAPPKPVTVTTRRTGFVANPQVTEVSNYFNQRWEPPSNLRSSLEYSIVLDVDGSIQVIEPYGLASRTYLDRTGMPLIGESFVSANQNGQSPRIRLRFNPNGKVQAFLETGDAR